MLGKSKLNELPLRKQALILESELNRLALMGELQNVRSASTNIARLAKPGAWLVGLAPVAGFVTSRLLRRPRNDAPSRLASMLRCVPPLYSLWRRLRNGE